MPNRVFPTIASTTEDAWLAWAAALPELEVDAPRAVVVTPHPDDETLGCGGLIADLVARGAEVIVVAVTDGEASHPGHATIRAQRRAEQDEALHDLGVLRPAHRLMLPDGSVSAGDALRSALASVVREGDVVVAPWELDGHCDHDACGAVAADVARRRGCRLLAYPIWAWQWADPEHFANRSWRRRAMSTRAHAAKVDAIGRYRTQITEIVGEIIVTEEMLVRFRRPFEVFADVG